MVLIYLFILRRQNIFVASKDNEKNQVVQAQAAHHQVLSKNRNQTRLRSKLSLLILYSKLIKIFKSLKSLENLKRRFKKSRKQFLSQSFGKRKNMKTFLIRIISKIFIMNCLDQL